MRPVLMHSNAGRECTWREEEDARTGPGVAADSKLGCCKADAMAAWRNWMAQLIGIRVLKFVLVGLWERNTRVSRMLCESGPDNEEGKEKERRKREEQQTQSTAKCCHLIGW